jgi:hypothetical protein
MNPHLSEDQVKKIHQELEGLKIPRPSDFNPDVQNEEGLDDDYEEFTWMLSVYETHPSKLRRIEESLSRLNKLL